MLLLGEHCTIFLLEVLITYLFQDSPSQDADECIKSSAVQLVEGEVSFLEAAAELYVCSRESVFYTENEGLTMPFIIWKGKSCSIGAI
jgi:hypothetical protein